MQQLKHFCHIAFTGQHFPFVFTFWLRGAASLYIRFTGIFTILVSVQLDDVVLHEHTVVCCLRVDSRFTTGTPRSSV